MKSFIKPGKVNIIIDGQFGSSGKGVLAETICEFNHVDISVGALSPNAGHTFYRDNQKFVSKLIPVSAIFNKRSTIFLSADSVVDEPGFKAEIEQFNIDLDRIVIHPRVSVVTEVNKDNYAIGSTGKSVGFTRANKLNRKAILAFQHPYFKQFTKPFDLQEYLDWNCNVLVETGQGFDLGINHGYSYPYCTSVDRTVSNVLGELGVHPSYLGNVFLCIRTFPIRIASPESGSSGPFYDDSTEIKFEDIGVEPELTTVTKKIRRIATFSKKQFDRAVKFNKPDYIFMNFVNYLEHDDRVKLFAKIFKGVDAKIFVCSGPTSDYVNRLHNSDYSSNACT